MSAIYKGAVFDNSPYSAAAVIKILTESCLALGTQGTLLIFIPAYIHSAVGTPVMGHRENQRHSSHRLFSRGQSQSISLTVSQ
ncbi:hypothetical protein VTN02DRAFT_6018 [Thermoascus thermophilus]